MKGLIGMLYVAEVRGIRRSTGERVKWRVAVVGNEREDVDRKVRAHFDPMEFKEIQITSTLKVREKIHVLNTFITDQNTLRGQVVSDHDGTRSIFQGTSPALEYNPRIFAVGIATTVLAADEKHALRKLGNYLVNANSESNSVSGSILSEGSTITVEEVARSSGYAMPRDVSNCINKARMVRG